MVRRRSTVRFRNGAPAQDGNSNGSNRLWGPFREPIGPLVRQVCLGLWQTSVDRSQSLCQRFRAVVAQPWSRPRPRTSAWRSGAHGPRPCPVRRISRSVGSQPSTAQITSRSARTWRRRYPQLAAEPGCQRPSSGHRARQHGKTASGKARTQQAGSSHALRNYAFTGLRRASDTGLHLG